MPAPERQSLVKPLLVGGSAAVGALVWFLHRQEVVDTFKGNWTAGEAAIFRRVIPASAARYAEPILAAASATGISPFVIVALGLRETAWGTTTALRPPAGGPSAVGDATPRWHSSTRLANAEKIGATRTGRTRTTAAGTVQYEVQAPPIGIDGARGWGMGLMQLDAESYPHLVTSGRWRDPVYNVLEGAKRLRTAYDFFGRTPVGTPLAILKGRPDPRPLTGRKRRDAAIAAYNAGEGNVIRAIANGQPPSSVTTGGDYADAVNKKSETLIAAFVEKGGRQGVA